MPGVNYQHKPRGHHKTRNVPNPLPCDYDSEKNKMISDNESQTEEDSDEEKPIPFSLPQRSHKRSSSSSDSSSDESHRKPNKRKKKVNKRFDDVNENLGNIDGRLVAMEDGVGNISKEICQTNKDLKIKRNHQKTDNDAFKEAFENRSRI